MPNWCMNQLRIEHDDQAMIQRFEKAFNEERTCSEFLPKPSDIGEGWWEWCVENWGTKWDFGGGGSPPVRADGNKFVCTFETAWAPPIGLYKELDRLGYRVDATYFEPGIAFCGTFANGEDNCVSYTKKEEIPRRIWDEYELAEWFEEAV